MPRLPDPAPLADGVRSFADFLSWLGVPAERVLLRPPPGMANVSDVLRMEREENRQCELVCGTLVEKRLGYKTSAVAAALLAHLEPHVAKKPLGVVTGPEAPYRLGDYLVRIPAVAFCAAGSYPGDVHPGEAAPEVIPRFVAEVADEDTSPTEMTRKVEDYFSAGVKLVWVIDLEKHTAIAYTSPKKSATVSASGTLDAGRAVPGFKLPVKQLFEHLTGKSRK